jgi:tryptophan 2,3-dioxygenase
MSYKQYFDLDVIASNHENLTLLNQELLFLIWQHFLEINLT